jgi:hypothetical protein
MSHFLSGVLSGDGPFGLQIVRSGAWLVTSLEFAFDSKARTRGLLGRNGLAEGGGLIIAPSQGVHTFGMQFPIDVVFVRRDGRVARCRSAVPPRRLALWLSAFAVLELPAGQATRVGLEAGDVIRASVVPSNL